MPPACPGVRADQGAGARVLRASGHADTGADRRALPRGECRAQPSSHGAARPCRDRAGNHARRLAQRGPPGCGSRAARLPQAGSAAEAQAAPHDRGGGRHGGAPVGGRARPGGPARDGRACASHRLPLSSPRALWATAPSPPARGRYRWARCVRCSAAGKAGGKAKVDGAAWGRDKARPGGAFMT